MSKHFFKSLEIKNFRGIREGRINDFARINLFVGRNSCGKTTVLESLSLLAGIGDPNLIVSIQNLRNISLTEPEDIRDFFFGRKPESFELKGVLGAGARKLVVKPFCGASYVDQAVGSADGNGSNHSSRTEIMGLEADSGFSGFEYEFFVSDEKNKKPEKYRSRITAQWIAPDQAAKFQPSFDEKYEERSIRRFLIQNPGHGCNPVFVDKILEEKQKDLLLDALQVVEPDILDIKVGPTKVVSADIGYSSFIPVNLLGSGLVHVISIVSDIFHTKGAVLMVDEIGSGLHVSCLQHLWKIIVEQSRKFNTQMFITTHSKDVIEGLVGFYEQESSLSSEDENAVACFYLDKNSNNQVKGYRYSPEQIRQILESGTDIRH